MEKSLSIREQKIRPHIQHSAPKLPFRFTKKILFAFCLLLIVVCFSKHGYLCCGKTKLYSQVKQYINSSLSMLTSVGSTMTYLIHGSTFLSVPLYKYFHKEHGKC